MNWDLVAWFAGVIGTLIGIKFVWTLFRTLFSKESMVKVIDGIGNGAANCADKMTNKMTEKWQEGRERRRSKQEQKEENNKPVVFYR